MAKRPAPPPSPAPLETPAAVPYLPGDRDPVGKAVEKNTETTWKLFDELAAQEDMRYADTVPIGTAERPQPDTARPMIRPAAPAPVAITIAKVLLEATRNNRVCPKPDQWQAFYELLASAGSQSAIPAPLVGRAWAATPALAKRMCLKDQIQWAAANNMTDPSYRYLRGLPEDQWHHMGD